MELIRINVQRTSDVDVPTRNAIVRMCSDAHGVDFDELFTRHLPPDGHHVVATINHDVVGHAVITTRWLQYNNGPPMRTAYIDAVATSPSLQGQGIASAVMRRVAQLASDDHVLACLETDRPGFYARLGWEPWRGPLAGRGTDGLVPTPHQTGIMILRLPHTPPLAVDGTLTIQIDQRIW